MSFWPASSPRIGSYESWHCQMYFMTWGSWRILAVSDVLDDLRQLKHPVTVRCTWWPEAAGASWHCQMYLMTWDSWSNLALSDVLYDLRQLKHPGTVRCTLWPEAGGASWHCQMYFMTWGSWSILALSDVLYDLRQLEHPPWFEQPRGQEMSLHWSTQWYVTASERLSGTLHNQ